MRQYALAFILSLTMSLVWTARADVTISGTVTNAQDHLGFDIAAGRLTLLIVDAGDDAFGSLLPGSLSAGSFLTGASDLDLFLAGLGSSFNFGDGIASFGLTSVTLGQSNGLGDSTSTGDDFYVLWFPDLPDTTTSLSSGDRYGLARFTDWELPSDGNPIIGTTVNGGTALLQVIPEPSTYALIAMGLGLIGLRFRRRK